MGGEHAVAVGALAGLLGGLSLAAAAALIVGHARRSGRAVAQSAAGCLRVFSEPPSGWVFVITGAAIMLPFLALHGTYLLGPSPNSAVGDADSARLVSSVRYVWEIDWRFLVSTQEFALPHLLYGPALAVWGIGGAIAISLITMIGLGALLGYLAWRMTQSPTAGLLAPLAWVAVNMQTRFGVFLVMYPLTLLLGYAGGWVAYRASGPGEARPWRLAFAAGALLALSPEAHTIGQLFWAAPLLLLAFDPTRARLTGVARVYAAFAVCMIPRAVVNFAEGGLAHFRSGRVDYWVTEGYITLINQQFFGRPGGRGTGTYLRDIGGDFARQSGWPLIVVLLAALAVLVLSTPRVRRFTLACLGLFLASILITQVPLYPRYYSPLLPGLALLAATAVPLLRRRFPDVRFLGVGLTVLIAAAATLSFVRVAGEVDSRRAGVAAGPYHELAAAIDDDRAVVGSRAHQLNWVEPDIRAYGPQFLTEEEFATYLSWPSDAEVLAMFEQHNIGWVLTTPYRRLEAGYHDTWLSRFHDTTSRHLPRLRKSPSMCLERKLQGYALYRVGPCS